MHNRACPLMAASSEMKHVDDMVEPTGHFQYSLGIVQISAARLAARYCQYSEKEAKNNAKIL